MSKVWKSIPGFSCYRVSEIGEVECIELRGKMQTLGLLTPYKRQGYRDYSLRNDRGNSKTVSAHRLVALAFLPPAEPGQVVVRHLNGVRCCNHFSNLAWGSNEDNVADMMRHGTCGTAKLTDAEVLEIRASTEPARALAQRFGVQRRTIIGVLAGRSWRHLLPRN